MKKNIYMISLSLCLTSAFLCGCSKDIVTESSENADIMTALSPDTPVGISASLEGCEAAVETRLSNIDPELYATTSANLKLSLPGGFVTSIEKTNTINNIAEAYPLYMKDFNLVAGNDRCISRWTMLEADNVTDYAVGWARLDIDKNSQKPGLHFGELKRTNAKITIRVVDASSQEFLNFTKADVVASYTLPGASTTAIETSTGKELTDYLSGIKNKDDDPADDSNFALAVYPDANASNSGEFYMHNGAVSAIVRPTATHAKNQDATYTAQQLNFTETDLITVTIPDSYYTSGNKAGSTYTLKFKDITAGNNVPESQKTSEGKLKYLTAGDHLQITITIVHNTYAEATATIGSWTEKEANGGNAVGGDGDVFAGTCSITNGNGITYYKSISEMTENLTAGDAVSFYSVPTESEVAAVLAEGITDLTITGVLTGAELFEVGSAIRALETRKDGEKSGTISLSMPHQTTIPAESCIDNVGAFEDCIALKSVSMPVLTAIYGDQTFYKCFSITDFDLESLKSISQSYIFGSCESLTSIELPDLQSIEGEYTFLDCPITRFSFPSLVSIKGDYTFHMCQEATEIDLPVLGTIDGNNVFANCKGITTLTLPKVSSIKGKSYFYNCTNLTKIKFGTTVNSWVSDVFNNFTSSTCDLILKEGQSGVGGNHWAGKDWKSISYE